jgi:putative redox protein
MDDTITANGLRLAAHLALPSGGGPAGGGRVPAAVICHGFPRGPRGAVTSAATYPELADRIARDAGWVALTFNFRGTGTSEGDFSVGGWLADLRAVLDHVESRDDVRDLWLIGIAEGGTLAVCAAARDPRVRGVATMAAPTVLRELGREPSRMLATARSMGMVKSPDAPDDLIPWAREIARIDAVAAARELAPRPLLVLHGSDDDAIDPANAVELAEAGGTDAELRIVFAAGHRLRHDPRAVAALLGWLDRQTYVDSESVSRS